MMTTEPVFLESGASTERQSGDKSPQSKGADGTEDLRSRHVRGHETGAQPENGQDARSMNSRRTRRLSGVATKARRRRGRPRPDLGIGAGRGYQRRQSGGIP